MAGSARVMAGSAAPRQARLAPSRLRSCVSAGQPPRSIFFARSSSGLRLPAETLRKRNPTSSVEAAGSCGKSAKCKAARPAVVGARPARDIFCDTSSVPWPLTIRAQEEMARTALNDHGPTQRHERVRSPAVRPTPVSGSPSLPRSGTPVLRCSGAPALSRSRTRALIFPAPNHRQCFPARVTGRFTEAGAFRFLSVSAGRRRPDEDLAKKMERAG